ncbi:MAG: hypothetical protein Q9174_005666 [Haloplaca sp. 1 TL-2023]
MKDPVPDFVFGIRELPSDRNKPKISSDAEKLVRISGTVPHCFFIIEAKGADEPFANAETQAIRCGAVLVNARRLLVHKAAANQQAKVLGPDKDSFVYTCAWMPPFARIFVNWCQVEEEVNSYHMNHVRSYNVDDEVDIKSFRDTIHSIFDWGLDYERVEKIQTLVRAVEENETVGTLSHRHIITLALWACITKPTFTSSTIPFHIPFIHRRPRERRPKCRDRRNPYVKKILPVAYMILHLL